NIMEKNGYMQDDIGNMSSMRLMSLISLLAAIGIAAATLFLDVKTDTGTTLTVLFLTAAFCPKTLQKAVEKK
ncbi:MAG: hypothetical protein GY749_34495, partial [Desulfobacteraceae bacterium]|nr:hypothetical protein [Desulfobacteraceae bacterium]